MAFGETWSETDPANHTKFNAQPGHVRDAKTAIRERLQFGGMYFPSTHDEAAGEHTNLRMRQTTKPTNVADKGFIYCKDVSGATELFYEDEAGNEIQLTAGGVLLDSVNAKTGDWLHSSVTTARTGWTNVSATYSNKFIRINATPLTTGGADTHTHAAGSLAGPAHTHTVPASSAVWGTTTAVAGKLTTGQDGGSSASTDATTSSSGTGAVTGTTAAGSNVPAYVQAVLFQKD